MIAGTTGEEDTGADRADSDAEPEERPQHILEERYPARRILALIGDKWTPILLYCFSRREVRRFNELQRQIPDISRKMLIQTLRNLERDGLVHRTVYQQVPPKTEYRLTKDGQRIREPIIQLCNWARENDAFLSTVLDRREEPNSTLD